MMEVLMIGNGFDLSCNLPTTYRCFLLTVGYIIRRYVGNPQNTTIYEVFSALKNRNKEIAASVDTYEDVYKECEIDSEFIWKLSEECCANKWWQYFSNNVNKNIGWIDFEKEIKKVLDIFEEFFINNDRKEAARNYYNAFLDDETEGYLKSFHFFFTVIDDSKRIIRIESDFLKPHHIDNTKRVIDRGKIINELYKDLIGFMDIMREYFRVFVDETLDRIKACGKYKLNDNLKIANRVITFNYTSSMEKLYNKQEVVHIHGKTDGKIVLGVNPDDNDKAGGDTTFMPFKKYFQRVIGKIDLDYQKSIQNIIAWKKISGGHVNLSVFGHSLNVTDKDIIAELFNVADDITIYYHSVNKLPDFVRNLVMIFSKEKFDELRLNKNLTFEDINIVRSV